MTTSKASTFDRAEASGREKNNPARFFFHPTHDETAKTLRQVSKNFPWYGRNARGVREAM